MKIERIENIMRTYGIDGEDAFYVLASRYIACFLGAIHERLFAIQTAGKTTMAKYAIQQQHLEEIEGIVKGDDNGDMLPILYQHFLSKRFRESAGKFFTPQPIAASMSNLLTPFEKAVVADPCCGSGTFLRMASDRWGSLDCRLVGNDIDPLLVDLTELSLSLVLPNKHTHELLRTNIYDPNCEMKNLFGSVDYILANPPFSIPISSFYAKSRLFELGYTNSDALFLDIAYSLLKPSGRLVCLLPHSIVTNSEFSELRKEIEKQWFILGVITLPEGIFYTSAKTSTRADILVLEKISEKSPPEKSFFCYASSVGIPLKNHFKEKVRNQLLDLVQSKDIQEILAGRMS